MPCSSVKPSCGSLLFLDKPQNPGHGLQTLPHSPRLEKGRKRLGWGWESPGCHSWPCHLLPAALFDFPLPTPAQHTKRSCTGPGRYTTLCHSYHPSLRPPASAHPRLLTHSRSPCQGFHAFLCLVSIPPAHHTFMRLLCCCVFQNRLLGAALPLQCAWRLYVQPASQD